MTSTFEHRDPDDSLDDSLNELPPGKFLGRYQITRLIGRGGMGCVYEAVHRDLGKRVAIKTLLPSLAASEEARGRFLREGQAASRIRHPHVVDVTDVVAEGPVSYLVMEYLDGEDLSSLIERQGALPLAEAADVLLPVIAAISAAHELGVIHRDLKPENIFLARTSFGGPCPKVVDFGISKVLGEPTAIALTATSAVFGTMFYLPPEQLGGSREADARGDQYALGTILYECVTGHRAFEGTSIYGVLKSVAEGVYPPARSWRPDLPPRLETAIDRAMRINPAARFSSVRRLGAELLPHASPPVRAIWTPVFGDAGGEGASRGELETPDDVEAPVRVGTGTMLLRAGDRTATFPPARDPVGAGVGEAELDLDSELGVELLRPPRSWVPRWAVIGVALGLAVAAVVSGVRRRTVAPVEPAEAESVPPQPAPRAAPAESAAPVPPVPLPPRAPVPAPIPPIVERPAARSPRRDSILAPGAPVRRRRKPKIPLAPPSAIDPAPEVRTNVPIPD
jgi:serine/threonine-protein kinase